MSGPSWCSTSFDLAAAPRSCSRSKVPTLGISLSMTNLRSAMVPSHKQRPHEFLNYEAFGLGAIRDSLTRQGIPLRSSVIERRTRREHVVRSTFKGRLAALQRTAGQCQGTKSLRDSGEVRLVLSIIPRGEIVGSGGSVLS